MHGAAPGIWARTLEFAFGMTWLIFITTLLAYAVYYTSMRLYPVAKVSSAIYLGPPVKMILACALFSELLIVWMLVGSAITFVGVVITSRNCISIRRRKLGIEQACEIVSCLMAYLRRRRRLLGSRRWEALRAGPHRPPATQSAPLRNFEHTITKRQVMARVCQSQPQNTGVNPVGSCSPANDLENYLR